MAAHWTADRQIGPSLMRFGTHEQRMRFLPGIAAGEVYFAIGMSEPDSGSDLASVRTKADRVARRLGTDRHEGVDVGCPSRARLFRAGPVRAPR